MNLAFKPNDIKKHIIETKINRYFEGSDVVKSASFFDITLTHIETGVSVNLNGYNKVDVFSQCLKILNDYIIAKQFEDSIPQENATYVLNESNTIAK